MAKTLTEIETSVKHLARDSNLTITSGTGLIVTNRIYRDLCNQLPWSELRKVDTSLTTVAGQEDYTWPTTNTFLDVTALEVQDSDSDNEYRLITSPVDEWTWNESARKIRQSVPDHYTRYTSGNDYVLSLRPLPKYTGQIIKITGSVEPLELQDGNSTTIFNRKSSDDVLELLIGADYSDRDGHVQWSTLLKQKANLALRQLFGKDQVPDELLRQIVQE